MKFRTAIAIGCLALFGFVQTADARRHHVKHHVVKTHVNTGGTSVSTTDVNGDGTSDVIATKPKPK
jgi:hypothetical protein